MMNMVSEKVIDAVIDELDRLQDHAYDKKMDAFAEAQPVLFSYLFSEQFELLTEDEKGYLQYLALIIWVSVEREMPDRPEVSEEQIGDAEEINFGILENTTGAGFRDRLNPFFDHSNQEDLLAFAEDALIDDDDPDSIVTKEGREPMFVALKTVVDVLCAAD